MNVEKNSITTSIFRDYINITQPYDESNVDQTEVSKNTVIIEVAIFDKNGKRCSDSFIYKVCSKCGDADAMTFRNKHIYQVLKFFMLVH